MKPSAMLPVNENILKARFPLVYKRIIDIGPRMPTDFYFENLDDSFQLMIQRGEYSFPVYGTYKRDKILKRWYDGLVMAKESLYAITGFGDGSHLNYFLKESGSGTVFLAAEKDPALLRETFARFDLSELLSNDRFILGVGSLDDEYFNDIQGAALTGVNDVNSLIFSPLHAVDEGYYDKMRNELVRQYLVVRPLMEVNVRTATNIQENTLRNLPHLAQSPDVGELENEFEDIPFILVGAGPSLDESIDFLKSVQDKAIIVCSNSPFRKLINSGVRPHLVVTADPMSPTLEGFKNIDLHDVPLACPYSAYPEIVNKFSGRVLTWSTFNPIIDALRSRTGRKPGTKILEKGTVSGCVLDLSRLLGCKKVMFIGQDMSVRDDGRYYTNDSSYSDSGSHYTNNMSGQRLPGNTQEKVIVEGRLFVYLKTFEQFISANKSVEYRNLARTGAKINGAPYVTYDEAFEWVGNTSNISFRDKVEELISNQLTDFNLEDILSRTTSFIDKLLNLSLRAAIETELLPDKFSGTNYAGNKSVTTLLKKADEINKLIDQNKPDWTVLFEGKTKGELVNYRRKIRDIDYANRTWTSIQRNKEYFWALVEGCYWFLNLVEQNIPSSMPNSLNVDSVEVTKN
jgi:hypothetical protein